MRSSEPLGTGRPGAARHHAPRRSHESSPWAVEGPGAPPAEARLLGLERFRLRRRLGAGSFGTVYDVDDRERGTRVALKLLAEDRPEAVYRFKREFRALSDVSHPNLVALHQLLAVGEQWLFTMELVDGTDLLAHVRGGVRGDAATASGTQAELRLRAALAQLAAGVDALHQAGKLHRDLKPSNVLVDRDGRVVVLDFGLVGELGPDGLHESTVPQLVGTAAYMAPEQARAERLTPASDWYSVGVILYEALTGRLPFRGSDLAVLVAKLEREPPPPRALAADVPLDLSALCAALLRRDPVERACGEQVLNALRGAPSRVGNGGRTGPGCPGRTVDPPRAEPFVGRAAELEALGAALRATAGGRAVVVHVRGGSGVGKTALVRRFVDGIAAEGGAVLLQGRCYERESVPYKGVDVLVDALTAYLARLPHDEALELVPRDVHTLVRLFPVLERVRSVADSRRRLAVPPDPQELRRRAFASFRDLMARIAERRPLVLWLDDFQWVDFDSVALLTRLVHGPDAPPLMLVLSFRADDASDDVAGSPALRAYLAPAAAAECSVETRELALAPLGDREACEAASALLGDAGADGARAVLVRAIASESCGNPFFLGELARFFRSVDRAAPGTPAAAITLDAVIRARVAQLPDGARRLLEVVAVSGSPLLREVAFAAAAIAPEDAEPLAVLRANRFVRTRGAQDSHLEAYHDRIREAVLAVLPPDRLRARHLALAVMLEASGAGDPEALAGHFAAAGRTAAAGWYALLAADQAASQLAFERAARLYRLALDLQGDDPAARPAARHTYAKLGDALANAGRGEAAALAYLGSAAAAPPAESIELRRRAAEQWIRSGHLEEGWRLARGVLGELGLVAPDTTVGTLAAWVWHRARLGVRGLRARGPGAPRPRALARIDVCWTLSLALGIGDPFRGAYFQTCHLLQALRAGDPYRVARALAAEVAYSALAGTARAARTARIARRAAEAAEALGDPAERDHAVGLAMVTDGIGAYMGGRFPEAAGLCADASRHLKERCAGAAWELGSAQLFHVRALELMGLLAERIRLGEAAAVEAEQRSDTYAAAAHRTLLATGVLLRDDAPDRMRHAVDDALPRAVRLGSPVQRFEQMQARVEVELYAGEFERAYHHLASELPGVRRALLLQVQLTRIWVLSLRLRCALGLAAPHRPGWEWWARAAERDARRLARERAPWAGALSLLGRAGLSEVRGDVDVAAAQLRVAGSACAAAGMLLHSAAARRRCGTLLGGDGGAALVADADAWMATQQVRSPARVAAFFAPLAAP